MTPPADASNDASRDPSEHRETSSTDSHDAASSTTSDAGASSANEGDTYRRARKDFDGLDLQHQASFLVDATVSFLARGIETAGRTLASELEDIVERRQKPSPEGAPEASSDPSPTSEHDDASVASDEPGSAKTRSTDPSSASLENEASEDEASEDEASGGGEEPDDMGGEDDDPLSPEPPPSPDDEPPRSPGPTES